MGTIQNLVNQARQRIENPVNHVEFQYAGVLLSRAYTLYKAYGINSEELLNEIADLNYLFQEINKGLKSSISVSR